MSLNLAGSKLSILYLMKIKMSAHDTYNDDDNDNDDDDDMST